MRSWSHYSLQEHLTDTDEQPTIFKSYGVSRDFLCHIPKRLWLAEAHFYKKISLFWAYITYFKKTFDNLERGILFCFWPLIWKINRI